MHLCRARDPEVIKLFVEAARYPFQKIGNDKLSEGVRGWGSQKFAAWVWGIDEKEYLKNGDVLPDNVISQIEKGVMIGAGRREDSAEIGRKYTKRKMPW